MSEEGQNIDVGSLPKFDMPLYSSEMTAKDVKLLALRHDIPLDLHPIALTKEWTMDQLPKDMIGLYEQYFEFSGIRQTRSLVFFREKGWRAIPDAMAYRHHDSDVNDPIPKDGFHASDVPMLTEQVVDLRLVPSGLLFLGGLATTWDFLVVTMSEYLRFPFLSGASISKGPPLTSQYQIVHHTTPLLSLGQNIPAKTDHQKKVVVEDPKIVATRERKARVAAKKSKENLFHTKDELERESR
uniref:Uncharacterized protein n=1 Tax=Tanacetum cinerariifolium TaxID=118510 RepID=A0A699H8Y3_TANCI|nr:hypothetical protein [Tanacetum cinerariifolium]